MHEDSTDKKLDKILDRLDKLELENQQLRQALVGQVRTGWAGYEYKSGPYILGLPLVHIAYGFDPQTGRKRVARGIIAIGDIAIGGFAMGGLSIGLLSLGGLSLGLLAAFGGLAMSLGLAIGGGAIGTVAIGGGVIGYWGLGGGVIAMKGYGGGFLPLQELFNFLSK